MKFSSSILRNLVFVCCGCAALAVQAEEDGTASDRLEEEMVDAPSQAPTQNNNDNSNDAAHPPTATPAIAPALQPEPESSEKVSPTATGPTTPIAPTEPATEAPESISEKSSSETAPESAAPLPSMTSSTDEAVSTKAEAQAMSGAREVPSGDRPGDPTNYLLSYSLDWTYVAASAGIRLSGVWERVRPPTTWLGPQFNENDNPLASLQEPRLFGAYNLPMLQEKVSVGTLVTVGAAAVAIATGIDGALTEDAHRAHLLGLGALVSTLFTSDMTELLKLGVGRLRPDFAERYQRAACQGLVAAPDGIECTLFNDGFEIDEKAYFDGFKSFPSGHASTSFALATYLSLWLNRTWVFGKRANAVSQPLAVLASGLLYSGAFFTAASRVADHRHHPEDVAVGAALGTGIGAATWLLYFDLDGEARNRTWSLLPQTYPDGGGVALSGEF